MKKPHSLYLSALPHNRLSTYVENALDGAGSLSGLIAFVEERTQAMLGREDEVPWGHPADEKFESLSLLDYRQFRQPLTDYSREWGEFASALPWYADNPIGAHILALSLLTDFPSLWEAEYEKRDLPRHHLKAHPVTVSTAMWRIRTPHVSSVQAVDRSSSAWQRARPLFGRDRIDFIVADRQVPVSIYLDSDAHQMFYAAFGNRFFTRLEHSLIHMLEDPDAMVDIESAALFLELGPAGVDLDELAFAANEIPRTIAKYDSATSAKDWYRVTEQQLTKFTLEAGYSSLQDSSLLDRSLDRLYLRKRDIARTQGLDIWYLWPEVSAGTLATLFLGSQLSLIDGTDIRQLPQRIAVTLAERFGITDVAPTRENAFRLLAAGPARDDTSMTFANAVDMHMWALFVAYARHCLVQVPAAHPRISHSTLATLAEGDLFPRVGIIEAFTGAKLQKTPSGRWQLRKGRKIHTEIEHQSFLKISEALDGLVQLRDPITAPGDWDDGLGDVETVQEPQPYSYAVSPDVIARVLEVLATHDEKTQRQALKDALLREQPAGRTVARRAKKRAKGAE